MSLHLWFGRRRVVILRRAYRVEGMVAFGKSLALVEHLLSTALLISGPGHGLACIRL